MDLLARALARRAPLSTHCTKALRLQHVRRMATTTDASPPSDGPITAAEPFSFLPQDAADSNDPSPPTTGTQPAHAPEARGLRVVPVSRAYFSSTPLLIDDTLGLHALARRIRLQTLPSLPTAEVPKVYWKSLSEYQEMHPVREAVKLGRYKNQILSVIQRMNALPRSLMTEEVQNTIGRYMRSVQPQDLVAKVAELDKHGRARAVGRRKASSAVVYLVEGTGECLINGKTLPEAFGRVHDRESAIWPLKVTERMDKYNVWATCKGGGCTGQSEALMLGVAKALLIHEPALKPALRRSGAITRDVRRVERKKPGRLKARKMPTWVKR